MFLTSQYLPDHVRLDHIQFYHDRFYLFLTDQNLLHHNLTDHIQFNHVRFYHVQFYLFLTDQNLTDQNPFYQYRFDLFLTEQNLTDQNICADIVQHMCLIIHKNPTPQVYTLHHIKVNPPTKTSANQPTN